MKIFSHAEIFVNLRIKFLDIYVKENAGNEYFTFTIFYNSRKRKDYG